MSYLFCLAEHPFIECQMMVSMSPGKGENLTRKQDSEGGLDVRQQMKIDSFSRHSSKVIQGKHSNLQEIFIY